MKEIWDHLETLDSELPVVTGWDLGHLRQTVCVCVCMFRLLYTPRLSGRWVGDRKVTWPK